MSTLKAKSGALLARGGHLCLTCCSPLECLVVRVNPDNDYGVGIYVDTMWGSVISGEFRFIGVEDQRLFWDSSAGSWVFEADGGDFRYTAFVPDRNSPSGRYDGADHSGQGHYHLDMEVLGPCE